MARLGQHFLTDPGTVGRIIAAAAISPGEDVVEIGPGKGVLTRALLQAGAKVTAVELDARLCESLKKDCAGFLEESPPRLSLVRADFLKLDPAGLPSPCAVVANLPYAVASPILQKILSGPGWTRAVLMFQKEVAERILARPGSRDYGVLTLSVLLKARAELVCGVPRAFFTPRPAVDSAVVRFDPLPRPPLPSGLSEEAFMSVVRAAFMHRRKRAANSLSRALKVPRERAEAALEEAGLPPHARAEEAPFEAFIRVAGALGN